MYKFLCLTLLEICEYIYYAISMYPRALEKLIILGKVHAIMYFLIMNIPVTKASRISPSGLAIRLVFCLLLVIPGN